ncbi:MAG: hypothetical protein NT120_02965 [Candidatus Aenigmarchaeota archaeon]|nr:hypothetical protein [Candidatus Aenigmarchaeota archaeon]
MFGWLKRKKDDDFDDIRSHVLNEPSEPRPEQFQPQTNDQRFDDEMTPRTRSAFEPFSPSMENMPSDFGNDLNREPMRDTNRIEPSKNYEIIDRLNLIESQLSAVRSMTETINERLKNMESKLGLQRRY